MKCFLISPTRSKKAIVLSVDNPGFCCVLDAPIHDGDGVYSLLREAGFPAEDIVSKHNADKRAIEDTLDAICKSLSQKKTGVDPAPHLRSRNNVLILFFSGYGVTIGDRKYLIPSIGAEQPVSDADLAAKSVSHAGLEAKIEVCASGLHRDSGHALPEALAELFAMRRCPLRRHCVHGSCCSMVSSTNSSRAFIAMRQ